MGNEKAIDYDRIHRDLNRKSAIKRERDLLESIAPAIAFLERKLADTSDALDGLRKVRATALREITRLEERGDYPFTDEITGSKIGTLAKRD